MSVFRSVCRISNSPKSPCIDWTFWKVTYIFLLSSSPHFTSRRLPALPHWTQLQVWTMNPGQVTQAKSSKAQGQARDSMGSSVSPWISPSTATSEGRHGHKFSHDRVMCGHMDLAPSQMRQLVCWFTCTWGFPGWTSGKGLFFASSSFMSPKQPFKNHLRFLQSVWTWGGMWFIFVHIAADSVS